MTTETVYKVVCKRKTNYYSINARSGIWFKTSLKEIRKRLDGCLSQYKLNKETRRKRGLGPLLAFDTLEQAELFSRGRSDGDYITIFECKGVLSEEQNYNIITLIKMSKARDYWSDKEIAFLTYCPPPGTVFCDSITPTKVAKNYDKV